MNIHKVDACRLIQHATGMRLKEANDLINNHIDSRGGIEVSLLGDLIADHTSGKHWKQRLVASEAISQGRLRTIEDMRRINASR